MSIRNLVVRFDLDHRLRRENLSRYMLQCGLAAVVVAGVVALSIIKRLVLPLLMDLL